VIKKNRTYELVHINNDLVTTVIKPPFTLQFDVERNNFGTANIGSVRIFNLSKDTRERLRKDQTDFTLKDKVILTAGYEDNLALILDMTVNHGWSVREGNNFITQLQCLDGGYAFANARAGADLTFGSGEKQQQAIARLVQELKNYGLSKGAIGAFDGVFTRSQSYTGNPLSIIDDLTGGARFIDNSVVHVIKDNEAVGTDIFLITPESGLLNTPMRENQSINFTMLFEPKLSVGKVIKLESFTGDKDINATYKIRSIHHRGIISDAVGGECVTEINCVRGDFLGIPLEFK
jgi:hypothetical protein